METIKKKKRVGKMIKIVTRSLSNHESTYLQWDLIIFGFLQFFSFTLQKLCLLAANFGKNRIVSYRCSIWIWNFVFWVKKNVLYCILIVQYGATVHWWNKSNPKIYHHAQEAQKFCFSFWSANYRKRLL